MGKITTNVRTSAPSTAIYNTAGVLDTINDEIYTTSERENLRIAAKNNRRIYRSKNVNHYKTTFVAAPVKGLKVSRPPNSTYLENSKTFNGLPHEIASYWGFGKTLPGVTIYDRSYRISQAAIEKCFSKMFTDANLLELHDQNLFVTLGELKDFKKTVQTVTKHTHIKDREYVADKYLGVNFGLLPFYDDIMKYRDNYNNFAPNLKRWNDLGRKGKVLNAHGTIANKKDTQKVTLYTGSFNWPSGLQTYKYKCEYTIATKLVAKCSAHFQARPMESSFDQAALLASINGLSKPATAMWNLLPFSFVVDWFANVGDQIEALEWHRPYIRFNILGGSHSMKVVQQLTCDVTLIDTGTGAETYIGSSQRTADLYIRIPYGDIWIERLLSMGPISSPFEFKTELSGYQWSLAAALAVTTFPGKK